MNFFGHAAVASWCTPSPAFVLGAMLPDLAGMIRARPPEPAEAALAAGVAFHHVTDDVFHASPEFRELTGQAFDQLSEAGLSRGAARAVAHVGVEILLDGVLAGERGARRAYVQAIHHEPNGSLSWSGEAEALAFRALLEAMRARGISRSHATPAAVAFRVERALSGRPRLALARHEVGLVERWAESAASAVRARTPSLEELLLRELVSARTLAAAP